jgi:membrane-associated protease RseP (regulator of RpoE activity)
MELNFNLISIIMFYVTVALLLYRYRKHVQFQKIIVFIKSKFGIRAIEKIAKLKTFWKYWGYIGIPAGFVGMFAVFYLLSSVFYKMLTAPETAQKSVQLIFPGTTTASVGPVLFVPFWYFIISLAIVVFVHEGCHGILARVHDIKVKATGAGLFFFTLPFAFVEPDEKQLVKAKLHKQLSVYAAGPFANICLGFILLAITLFGLYPLSNTLSEQNGVYVVSVAQDMPAAKAGLAPGDIIVAANSIKVANSTAFTQIMDKVKPGEIINLQTENKTLSITTIPNKEGLNKAYIGVQFYTNFETRPAIKAKCGNLLPKLFIYGVTLVEWLVILNIGIGLINLLPLGPIDGGRMVKAVLEAKIKDVRKRKRIFWAISVISLAILLGSIIGPLLLSL